MSRYFPAKTSDTFQLSMARNLMALFSEQQIQISTRQEHGFSIFIKVFSINLTSRSTNKLFVPRGWVNSKSLENPLPGFTYLLYDELHPSFNTTSAFLILGHSENSIGFTDDYRGIVRDANGDVFFNGTARITPRNGTHLVGSLVFVYARLSFDGCLHDTHLKLTKINDDFYLESLTEHLWLSRYWHNLSCCFQIMADFVAKRKIWIKAA